MARPLAKNTIASTRNGLQQIPIFSERLTNCRYVNLNRIVFDDESGPDALHKVVFGYNIAFRNHKCFQNFKCPTADGYWRSHGTQLSFREVKLPTAELEKA